LSATPINNSVADLAAELAILLRLNRHQAEAIVGDIWRPGKRESLYPMMTRFSKESLGIHFAVRSVRDVPVEFPELYMQEISTAIKGLRGRPVSEALFRDEVTYFRLAASSPKAFELSTGIPTSKPQAKVEALQEILNRHSGERVIVFCEFEETAKELCWAIQHRPTFLMTGSVPVFDREIVVAGCRNTPDGVLVMTAVGTEGLDLQFCSTVVNFDLTWNPMVLEQRIGRIDRIGQQKETIFVYNILVSGSIDERIMVVLGRKLGLVTDSVLEPSSILSGGPQARLGMWSEEALRGEMKAAESVARALDLSRTIIPDDYGILEAIDESYCDLSRLDECRQGHDRLEWLRESDSVRAWREELDQASKELERLVAFYA
jgi:hypothetical protein